MASAKISALPAATSLDGSELVMVVQGGANKTIELSQVAKNPALPVLLVGGDHPFHQWYGSDGKNGLAQMYADSGFTPYVAINTDDGNTVDGDPASYMTYAQMTELVAAGKVEIVAHGHRHVQDWRLVNSGIKVRYTGPAATATVAITATNITGATAGAVEDFNYGLTTAPYDSLAEVVAAIDALPNWTASYASELRGTEKSTKLLIRAATDAKTADLYLAAGGGILITNVGTTYRSLDIGFQGTTLTIYGDGVRILNQAIAGNTLAQLVTAINAVTGVTAALTNDADRGVYNYLSGSEDAACLASYKWTGLARVGTDGLYLHSGLSHWYIVQRQMVKCKEVAAANGITLKHFAQSGDKFYAAEIAGHGVYGLHRGNNKTGAVIYPNAFIRRGNHLPHVSIDESDTYPDATAVARLTATLDALEDSPGFTVCWLMHVLSGDGSSGYYIPETPADFGAYEDTWAAVLAHARAKLLAGTIGTMTLDQYSRSPGLPLENYNNLLFNPKLRNSAESLLVAAADPGLIVPGWRLGTLAASTSAATIDADGYLSCTTSAVITPLQQVVMLDPGVYEMRMQVPELSYTSGSGLYLTCESYTPDYSTTKDLLPGVTRIQTTAALRGPGELRLRFSISPPGRSPARVKSKNAQTYNLSTNKNIRINIFNKGQTADIDCSAGAVSAAAVTAKEVAAAINAGMAAAAATYAAEYHTIARAVNNYVVLEAPYASGDVIGNIYVADGSTASARTAIFGDECYGVASLADSSHLGGIPLNVGVEQNMVGSATMGALSLRKVVS